MANSHKVETNPKPTALPALPGRPSESQNLSWDEIFALLDSVGVPDDFLSDRDQRVPEERLHWSE
jgi:hypothetical protein